MSSYLRYRQTETVIQTAIETEVNTATCTGSIMEIKSFKQKYELNEKIGQGAYSVVKKCTHIETGKEYAVKIVSKVGLSAQEDKELKAEVHIMQTLNHPYLCSLIEFYDEGRYYFIVLEFLRGGELFDRLVRRSKYSEGVARHCIRVICSGIQYMHAQGIVHRDIKPENLLLASEVDDDDVKICDFGLATPMPGGGRLLRQACGTPGYLAPEILQGTGYGFPVDMWAVGVVTYCLLAGYPPFAVDDRNKLYRAILKCDYTFYDDDWSTISDEAKDFVEMLLDGNMYRRMTAEQALEHPWMKMDANTLSRIDLTPRLEHLKSYQSDLKFKAAATVVLATNKLCRLVAQKKEKNQLQDGQVEADDDDDDDSGGVMLTPPSRVLDELEQHEISRSNSKTLSARLPDPSAARGSVEKIRQLGSGTHKSREMRSQDHGKSSDACALESARPGILHIGSGVGICRVGSSKSYDSSPRKGATCDGQSGTISRERSRSASMNADAYRALNLTHRSSKDSHDSKDRDDCGKSNFVFIGGSKVDVWEDADIVGSARAMIYSSHRPNDCSNTVSDTTIEDGLRHIEEDMQKSVAKSGAKNHIHGLSPHSIAPTPFSCNGDTQASTSKGYVVRLFKNELSLIPEDSIEKHSDKLSDKGGRESNKEAHPSPYVPKTSGNDSKRVPSLNMEQFNGSGGSHLPDVRCPHPSTTESSPGYSSRLTNKRLPKTSASPPRAAAAPTTLPSIGKVTSTSHTTPAVAVAPHSTKSKASTIVAGSGAGAVMTSSSDINRPKDLKYSSTTPIDQTPSLVATRPYVKYSASVIIGESASDLPTEEGKAAVGHGKLSSVSGKSEPIVRKKKKRFRGSGDRIVK